MTKIRIMGARAVHTIKTHQKIYMLSYSTHARGTERKVIAVTVIGILAPTSSHKIETALKKMFAKNHKRVATVRGIRTMDDELYSLKSIGTDYCIILFQKGRIYPHYVDILIVDNSGNDQIITYDLIKCISPSTRLIYNTDHQFMPLIEHPNAIDYGLSRNATVTVSSIDPESDGTSFVYCIQRPIRTLFDERMEEGEVLVSSDKGDVSNLLPTVTCGLLCGIFTENAVKI